MREANATTTSRMSLTSDGITNALQHYFGINVKNAMSLQCIDQCSLAHCGCLDCWPVSLLGMMGSIVSLFIDSLFRVGCADVGIWRGVHR